MNQTKQCSKCGNIKPLSQFHYRKDTQTYRNNCIVCHNTANETRRKSNKIKAIEENKQLVQNGVKKCSICFHIKPIVEFISSDNKEVLMCSTCRGNVHNQYEKHKPSILAMQRINYSYVKHTKFAKRKLRMQNDPNFRMSISLRSRVSSCLKSGREFPELIGCSISFLREWIEYNLKFTPELTWQNYGTVWHYDHVIPCKHFNMLEESHKKYCFNWRNLTPMEKYANQSKSNKIDYKQISTHNQRLIDFSKSKNIEVSVLDTTWIQIQPQLPPFIGNNKDEQVETVLNKDSRPSDGKNIEDEDSDYDSDIDRDILLELESRSEIGNPQQVLPVTRLKSGIEPVVLQLDILDFKHC